MVQSIVWIYHVLFIHSSVDGHFSLLWIVLLWIFVYKFLHEYLFLFFLSVYPGVELLDHVVSRYLPDWWNECQTAFQAVIPVCIFIHSVCPKILISLHYYFMCSVAICISGEMSIQIDLFPFFGSIGVWIQGLTLGRQALSHLSDTPSPFCFSLFFR
jgi:hypothetical protein